MIQILAQLAFFWLFYLKTSDNAVNAIYMWFIKQNKNMKGCHWH